MMASLSPQERLSQLLPSAKCSTCLQTVPLAELGEHICTPIPTSPTSPSRFKPAMSPTQPTFRSSPLARSDNDDTRQRPPVPSSSWSPLRPQAKTPVPSLSPAPPLSRAPNTLNNGLPPSPAPRQPVTPAPSSRPSISNNPTPTPTPITYPRRPGLPGTPAPGGPVPKLMVPPPPPPQRMPSFPSAPVRSGEAFVPLEERGIDTSSGGEAGMAGVGRRGFAAAARAAMFYPPGVRPLGPQQFNNNRRPNLPQNLDLDVAAAAQPSETPPLSAGSGYSSQPSPGPTSPLPQPEFPMQQQSSFINRTPSPPQAAPQILPTTTTPTIKGLPAKPKLAIPTPPLNQSNPNTAVPSSPRLPFFEKFKNKLESPQTSTAPPQQILNTGKAPQTPVANNVLSLPTTTTANLSKPPLSANSEIEYRLAYAESTTTDSEDNEPPRGRTNDIVSPPLTQAILRSLSNNSRVQFGSVSERSRSTESRIRSRLLDTERSSMALRSQSHSRDNSVSSYSSSSTAASSQRSRSAGPNRAGGHTRDRSNSSAIAIALGLCQTPPSEYGKLGGPGVHGGIGRSVSGSVKKAVGHLGNVDERSDVGQSAATTTTVARQLLSRNASSSAASSSSFNSRRMMSDDDGGNDVLLNLPGGGIKKAQRSNTVQSIQSSPDVKANIKLPMRALSEREKEKAPLLDKSGVPRKERERERSRTRKERICLKCMKVVEDGRWVSSDGGGILCERCWKNMYLPKCRRCNLPIEKQAVSSSDGQLKGKYHKDCFNCHTCHKPFPDKTFYVYDGKPLCAYHYHEANDSLCAAARCGQPIEGPCAVSHTGDRYHPEHMTCEYEEERCGERLEEYWEIEGRMLCERHALLGRNGGRSEEEEEEEEGEEERRRKMKMSKGKRVTRYIDLAGGAGLDSLR